MPSPIFLKLLLLHFDLGGLDTLEICFSRETSAIGGFVYDVFGIPCSTTGKGVERVLVGLNRSRSSAAILCRCVSHTWVCMYVLFEGALFILARKPVGTLPS